MNPASLNVLNFEEFGVVRPFFQGFNIYESFLRSIIDNRSAGRVLTDNKSTPSFVLICTPVFVSLLRLAGHAGGIATPQNAELSIGENAKIFYDT
ncbi:MAG: hypothetical protein LLG04_15865 [Parachlamydia sp.]|nr:hypothetical protein [Parachlamydia sp.]